MVYTLRTFLESSIFSILIQYLIERRTACIQSSYLPESPYTMTLGVKIGTCNSLFSEPVYLGTCNSLFSEKRCRPYIFYNSRVIQPP